MDSRIANADEAKLFSGKSPDRFKRNLQLISPNHILTRVNFNGHNTTLVARLKSSLESLIDPFPF